MTLHEFTRGNMKKRLLTLRVVLCEFVERSFDFS
jgi:hypothetical protein